MTSMNEQQLEPRGLHSGAVGSLQLALQQEGPGFESGSFCMEFAHSPCACVGSLWVLWLPPTVQNHDCQVEWSL